MAAKSTCRKGNRRPYSGGNLRISPKIDPQDLSFANSNDGEMSQSDDRAHTEPRDFLSVAGTG
jgi:hypothetical protein